MTTLAKLEQAQGWLYLLGLLVLAGLSYILLRWVESSMQESSPVESQAPILIVERFRAVRMNQTGIREYVVEAPLLKQLPNKLGTHIEQPVMDWYQPDGKTREWRVRADGGWVAHDQKTIRLEGSVVMQRTAATGKPPVEVTTRDILIRPTERYAETTAPVHALTPGGEFQAIGVRAYLDREQLELLSEVRGYYEPSKR